MHVCYEIEQVAHGTYRTTIQRLTPSGAVPIEDIHLGRAVHEAFLVHIRVLDDFLGKSAPFKEDLLAVDYCPKYAPSFSLDEDARTDIDRRVAHLTLTRTDDFQWGERYHLTRPVFKQFGVFVEALHRGSSRASVVRWTDLPERQGVSPSHDERWPDPAS